MRSVTKKDLQLRSENVICDYKDSCILLRNRSAVEETSMVTGNHMNNMQWTYELQSIFPGYSMDKGPC